MNLAIGLRNLRRVREILSVLAEFGLGYALDQLNLSHMLPRRRLRPAPEYAAEPVPRRVRLALTRLGPVFIKLGQMLSARPDMLSPGLMSELRLLQDEGPEVGFDEIRGVIERELGRPLEQCFTSFDPRPLSSASLGQVHAAVLSNGREVTTKVLRPGVRQVAEADLQILADAAHLVQRQVPALRRYDLPGFVRRLAAQIEDEMTYTREAHNSERIGRSLREAGFRVRVAEVMWDLTAREVLTTERLYGRRVDQLAEAAPGLDRPEVARQLGLSFLHQVFVDGFFHGDPHQGNVWVADHGALLLLDFGIVGYLEPRSRWALAEIVKRVRQEDIDGVMVALEELGAIGGETDPEALRSELTRLVGRFVNVPRQSFAIGELLSSLLRVLWLHHVRVPPDLALVAKSFLLVEGMALELDPDFDFFIVAQPIAEQVRAESLRPAALVERVLRAAGATARHLARAPARLDHVLNLLERGNLRLRVEDQGAERELAGLGRSLNRLALSVLAAALFVGSAAYLLVAPHPAYFLLGLVGLSVSVTLGVVVAVAVLRLGRI